MTLVVLKILGFIRALFLTYRLSHLPDVTGRFVYSGQPTGVVAFHIRSKDDVHFKGGAQCLHIATHRRQAMPVIRGIFKSGNRLLLCAKQVSHLLLRQTACLSQCDQPQGNVPSLVSCFKGAIELGVFKISYRWSSVY